MMKIDEETF